MRRARVVQQYVTAASNGGLKTEYKALISRETLSDHYEFIPVVLNNCHCGISLSDICFYRRAIRKADPDIVHIRGAGMESLNAVLGAKLSGSTPCAAHAFLLDCNRDISAFGYTQTEAFSSCIVEIHHAVTPAHRRRKRHPISQRLLAPPHVCISSALSASSTPDH